MWLRRDRKRHWRRWCVLASSWPQSAGCFCYNTHCYSKTPINQPRKVECTTLRTDERNRPMLAKCYEPCRPCRRYVHSIKFIHTRKHADMAMCSSGRSFLSTAPRAKQMSDERENRRRSRKLSLFLTNTTMHSGALSRAHKWKNLFPLTGSFIGDFIRLVSERWWNKPSNVFINQSISFIVWKAFRTV